MKIYLIVLRFDKEKIEDPLIKLLSIPSPAIITEKQINELRGKTGNKITIEEFFQMNLAEPVKTATLREITMKGSNPISVKTLQKFNC